MSTVRTTEFLILDRDDYESIMTMAQDSDAKEKMSILKSLPLFKTLSASLATMTHYCEVKEYPPNSLVICEGDVAENLYFMS